jgi:hypothetical protein
MNVISSAGSSIESKNMVISWTIGEDLIDFTMIEATMKPKTGNDSGVLEMKDGTLIKVYPTITKGVVNVEIRREEPVELFIEILDGKGSKLKSVDLDSDRMLLDFGRYLQGNYLLKISKKDLTDFKLISIVKV